MMNSIAEFRDLSALIVERVDGLGSSLRVLEVGCGSGLLASRLAHCAGISQFLAIEPDVRSGEVAKQRLRAISGRCRVDTRSLFEAAQDSGPVDVIVARFVYHHIPDEQKGAAAAIFARLLQPRGTLLLGDMLLPEYKSDAERVGAIRKYYQQTLGYARKDQSDVLIDDQQKCAQRDLQKRAEYKISLGWMLRALESAGMATAQVSVLRRPGGGEWPGVFLVESRPKKTRRPSG